MSQYDQDQSAETPRLGRYEILGEIASGGMATVFLARSVGAGGFTRLMAIKRLHPHLETDDDFVRMFLDEARLAARIRHPNVVATLDVEDHDGLYIVMEYIEGVTLLQLSRAAQKAGERIPLPVAARMALDTLAGLHAAHELRDENDQFLNLVHRDVSPQNVLLGTDGAARLTDFGIAKAASRLSMTRDGQLKGKISYMAPEQTRRGEVDRRADVFAMGIVVWELLAGRRLFSGESDVEVLNQLLFEPIPRLKDHSPGLPSMLEQTVMRALERDPNARYASAAQFADAIDRATRMLGGPANHRVVAAFIQKVAGERIARERGRIASGSPSTDSSSTGSYKALDANALPTSRVRPASLAQPSQRGFDPAPPRARSLRAPTMTGPVYSPDMLTERPSSAPRALRRPSPLRPPTMPAPGAPQYPTVEPYPSHPSSGPPAIIEFDPSEAQTVGAMPSPLSSPMRARTPIPSDAIDHEAVTRLDPMRLPTPIAATEPGSEAETLSMPVSMLFGAPQGAPNFAPHRSSPQHAHAPPEGASAPHAPHSHTPPPHVAPQPPYAPPPPPQDASPQPVTPIEATPAAPAPSPAAPTQKPRSRTLLFALALLVAMGIGAALTLYLTGFFNRPPPPAPRVVVALPPAPPAIADASVMTVTDAQPDGTPLAAADDASALAAIDDASALTADAPPSTDDASAVTTSDDATAVTADDDASAERTDDAGDASSDDAGAPVDASDASSDSSADVTELAVDASGAATEARGEEAPPPSPRRHHHRHRGSSGDAGAEPSTPGPLGDPFGN